MHSGASPSLAALYSLGFGRGASGRLTFADRAVRSLVVLVWLCVLLLVASRHTYFRDEVRAYSLAVSGGTVIDMLRGINGEGHPAVWYLLLRAAYVVIGSPIVLKVLSIAIALSTALLLLFRSPFRLWQCVLFLCGNMFLFEYSVMARNYGISALILFLFADLYPRHRERGIVLGVLLVILSNTNAHGVILSGGLGLFWLLDLLRGHGLRWTVALRTLLINGVLAACGMVLCFLTIYPPANDAWSFEPDARSIRGTLLTILDPARSFLALALHLPAGWSEGHEIAKGVVKISHRLLSPLLFASTLGLVRRPAALVAALVCLVVLSVFFGTAYPGYYRHAALWLVFILALYWIALARPQKAEDKLGPFAGFLGAFGSVCMLILMAMQLPTAVTNVVEDLTGRPPLSRVGELAAMIERRPELHDAIVMANPDDYAEALPYYVDNPVYMLHEGRFGRVSKINRDRPRSIDLDAILETARILSRDHGRPVVIVMAYPLDPAAPAQTITEQYAFLQLRLVPDQVARFLHETELLGRLRPARFEEFDAYLLKR